MKTRMLIGCLIMLLALVGTLICCNLDSTESVDSGLPANNRTQAVRQLPPSSLIEQTLIEPIKRGKALMDSRDLWRTPIQFFGKVVDENGNPVSGAQIHARWTDLSKQGHSEKLLHSDAGGLFVLKDVKGYALTIRVEKAGYYTSVSNRLNFFYAGQDVNFVPDSDKPILFH